MRPQRIAISLMVTLATRERALDGFAQGAVQDDRARRQALELGAQRGRRTCRSVIAVDGERLGGQADRRLVVLQRADHLAQAHRPRRSAWR